MLDKLTSTAPGRAFETDIANLLKASGFRVVLNAGAAKPRQTDIFARGAGIDLLVEVKDRKRKVDIGDIDSLRARLARTPSDVVGAIFTRSLVTRGAAKAIESDRTREIVVFIDSEIRQIRSENARLLNLLARKKEELRAHGRAWFWDSKRDNVEIDLPRSTIVFSRGGETRPYFQSKAGFAHASYALNLPDTSRGDGEGALLPLRLTLSTLKEMRDVLTYVHDRFGLSAEGSFSIHQSNASWHGVGVENFLRAAADWRQRYKEAGLKRVHHSEELVYFDRFRSGWLLLSAGQRVPFGEEGATDSFLHGSDLAIQLPGIPVDLGPFVDLCHHTGNEWGEFRLRNQRLTRKVRFKRPIQLQVVGTVIKTYDNETGDRWVEGLIARNPFYRKKTLPREATMDNTSFRDLVEIELLLCDLLHHIQEGDVVDSFLLHGIELTEAHHSQILRPFGTWNKIVRRAKSESQMRADAEKDLEAIMLEISEEERD